MMFRLELTKLKMKYIINLLEVVHLKINPK